MLDKKLFLYAMNYKIKLCSIILTAAMMLDGSFAGSYMRQPEHLAKTDYIYKAKAQEDTRVEIDGNQLYSKSAVLMDGSSGRILYGKDAEIPMANASMTKILTCIIALEECKVDEIVEISSNAVSQPKVHMGIAEGSKIRMEYLLYSLMLESHNDSAVAIAEHVAGSVEAFADKMNKKAAEIGYKDSYFITPNGLDGVDENGKHHITARDLALLMRYCTMESSQKEMFLQICQTKQVQFSQEDGTGNYICNNYNALLDQRSDVIAGKTGFTGDAGYCYVGAICSQDRVFIISLLACKWPNNKNYKWKDAATLLDYATSYYQWKEIPWNENNVPQIQISQWANIEHDPTMVIKE